MNIYNDIHTNSISITGFYVMKYFYYRYFNKRQFYEAVYNLIQSRIKVFIKICERNNIKILNKSFLCPFIYTNKSRSWWIDTYQMDVKCGMIFNDDGNSRINIMMTQNDWNKLIDFMSVGYESIHTEIYWNLLLDLSTSPKN